MENLEGRCAVVTGAASGIGKALSERFVADGMKVVLADVEQEPLSVVEKELREQGGDVVAVQVDVSDVAQVRNLAAEATSAFGNVHVLCNNAGVGSGGPIQELKTEDWEWVLGVNLWGVIHGLTSFLPAMIAHGEPAHVVNTASVAGLLTTPMMGPYNASKFAVVAISETLHHEMRLANTNVHVSVLCPGWVNTKIHQSQRNRPAALGGGQDADPDRLSMIAGIIESGMSPKDVAVEVRDAIRAERFWVTTHPEMLAGVESRLHSIITNANPTLNVAGLFGAGTGES